MLYAVLGIILVLLLVAVVRTFTIKAPAKIDYTPQNSPEELKTAEEKLGDMIRIPTVSKHEHEDLSDFVRYQQELERLFPKLHEKLHTVERAGCYQ